MVRSKLGKVLFGVLLALGLIVVFLLSQRSKPTGTDSTTTALSDPSHASAARLPNAPTAGALVATTDAASSDAGPTCLTTHCGGPTCDRCGEVNCAPTDGCDQIADANDKRLCEEVYACFSDPAHKCVNQGDPLKCWCGTNPTTCVTANEGPTRANGVCADKIYAAAKSTDANTIRHRFVDPQFPLGRAVGLLQCRGTFCASECKVP